MLVELLKQPAGQPLNVEQEVFLLFAGLNGYLETVPASEVVAYRSYLLSQLANSNLLFNFDIHSKINLEVFHKAFAAYKNNQ